MSSSQSLNPSNEIDDMVRFGIDPRLQACMPEVLSVLQKHGLAGKIGLQIMHTHFPVEHDEVMVETAHPDTRQLVWDTCKDSDAPPSDYFVSVWDPQSGRGVLRCPRTRQCHEITQN